MPCPLNEEEEAEGGGGELHYVAMAALNHMFDRTAFLAYKPCRAVIGAVECGCYMTENSKRWGK